MPGKRIALLIGVSEFGAEYAPLPNTVRQLDQLSQVLQNPDAGGFEVQSLLNPSPQVMREAIEEFFRSQAEEDTLLLYYSGRGEIDLLNSSQLYLTTHLTRKHQGQLMEASIVEAQFLYRQMLHSRSRSIVVILDCCYSGNFASLLPLKDAFTPKLKQAAILLSCPGSEAPLLSEAMPETSAFSLSFTHYLIEGIETGAVCKEGEQWLHVQDLYDYARNHMQSKSGLAGTPQMLLLGNGAAQIALAKVATPDRRDLYRQMVKTLLRENNGELAMLDHHYLYIQRYQLDLSASEAWEIETEQLAFYRTHLQKQHLYAKALATAMKHEYPFSQLTVKKLERIQSALHLEQEDADRIQQRLLRQLSECTTKPEQPVARPPAPAPQSVDLCEPVNQTKFTAPDQPFKQNGRSHTYKQEPILLLSAREVDYTLLQELLKHQNWKEADRETCKAMLRVAGRVRRGYLSRDDITNFPCQDLHTIDRLWVAHSNGQFGFSVQKDIWHSLGGTDEYDAAIEQLFCNRVGWAVQGKRISPNLNFDHANSVPSGMLPTCMWAGGWLFWWWLVTIQARLEYCRRSQWLHLLRARSQRNQGI
jgi:hypothetical protein